MTEHDHHDDFRLEVAEELIQVADALGARAYELRQLAESGRCDRRTVVDLVTLAGRLERMACELRVEAEHKWSPSPLEAA